MARLVGSPLPADGRDEDVFVRIRTEYRRIVRGLRSGRAERSFFDDRYLAELEPAVSAGDVARIEQVSRDYLASANLALVYPKILLHAAERAGARTAETAARLDEYRRASSQIRNRTLVASMTGTIAPADWEGARRELAALASAFDELDIDG